MAIAMEEPTCNEGLAASQPKPLIRAQPIQASMSHH
jgi:hypothetical protein